MPGFTIVVDPNKGRYIIANKFFSVGDIIFDEPPLVSCQLPWNESYKYAACEYCMRPLETAEENVRRLASDPTIQLPMKQYCPTLPIKDQFTLCANCGVDYCSEKCRQDAFISYHEVLCLGEHRENLNHPINKLLESWKRTHYPPESCSIMLLARILAMLKQSSNRNELQAKFSDFQSIEVNTELQLFHKMIGLNFKKVLDNLFTLTVKAFSEDEFICSMLTKERFRSLFAMIGTNAQGIGTSSLAAWETNLSNELDEKSDEYESVNGVIDTLYTKIDEFSGNFLNCEGTGLYLLQSKLNHSCTPNAEITFPYSNNVLSVRTLRDINVGDEICISYLDECMLSRSCHSRQKELKENYLFVCECPKCFEQKDDPDVTSDDDDEKDEDEVEMQEYV